MEEALRHAREAASAEQFQNSYDATHRYFYQACIKMINKCLNKMFYRTTVHCNAALQLWKPLDKSPHVDFLKEALASALEGNKHLRLLVQEPDDTAKAASDTIDYYYYWLFLLQKYPIRIMHAHHQKIRMRRH